MLHTRWMSTKNMLNISDADNVRQACIKTRNKVKAVTKSKCANQQESSKSNAQLKSNPKLVKVKGETLNPATVLN